MTPQARLRMTKMTSSNRSLLGVVVESARNRRTIPRPAGTLVPEPGETPTLDIMCQPKPLLRYRQSGAFWPSSYQRRAISGVGFGRSESLMQEPLMHYPGVRVSQEGQPQTSFLIATPAQ